MDRRTVKETVVGTVHVSAYTYTDRALATASWWDRYDVPEQDADIVTKWDNYGACWHAVQLRATLVESYRVSSLSTSVGAPGGGAWASSVDHKTDLCQQTTVHHSQPGPGMLEYFVGVLDRMEHFSAHLL